MGFYDSLDGCGSGDADAASDETDAKSESACLDEDRQIFKSHHNSVAAACSLRRSDQFVNNMFGIEGPWLRDCSQQEIPDI